MRPNKPPRELPRRLDMLLAFKAIGLCEQLSGNEKRVAIAVIDSFNRKTGQCDPSLNRIAHLLGLSRSTVIRAVRKFERLGFIIKTRHGGYYHRNAYQPNWARFREIEQRWKLRMQTSHLDLSAAELILSPVSEARHFDGGETGTETYRTNQSNLTSGNSSPTSSPVIRGSTSSGSPRKYWRQPPDTTYGLRAFGAAQRAASSAAEKKWSKDLHEAFRSDEQVYAKVIQAMDAALQDAATQAELAEPGGGCRHILDELRKRGAL